MKQAFSRFRAIALIAFASSLAMIGIGYTADLSMPFGRVDKLFKDIGSGYHAEAVYVYNSPTVTVSGIPTVQVSGTVPVREQVESLTYTHTNVSVDNASEALVASNASRKNLVISNDSDVKVYVNLAGGTASATAGVPLAAGSSLVMSAGEKLFTTSALTVITASGTSKSVNVAEGQ